jgi:hypothetical protein
VGADLVGVLQRRQPRRHLVRARVDQDLASGDELWFANTSAEAQVAAVLGRAGLNTIIASIQHEDSGGQEPECA